MTVNGALPEAARRRAEREVLPTLRATPAEEATTWALYEVSFRAAPGFALARRRLWSGDIALEFRGASGERLLLRQVYPGELALQRRSLEGWLDAYPFPEHRRWRRAGARQEPWRHGARPELSGLQRLGWKRLPAPLGACAPRRTRALAAHDRALDRLLIVEHGGRSEPPEAACVAALEGMNAAVRPGVAGPAAAPRGDAARDAAVRGRPQRLPPVRQEEREGKLCVTVRFRRPAWQRALGAEALCERTFGLDAFGRAVYESCDGRRTVAEIVRHFAAAQRLSLPEAELAVTRFLRTLIAKGLVAMAMEREGR